MFTPEQQRIYDGLKNIGESLANFYADAVRMVDPGCTIASKANIIAHMAREIDGGLRYVFAPDKIAKSNEALLTGKNKGHFASILTAVGKSDPENIMAKEWLSIASNFARITHRAEVHLSSKDATEMVELWGKYEKVLLIIVGSFLNITNRLDVLLSQDQPQPGSLPAIKNLLTDKKNANYFFSSLDKESWLIPLQEDGFFDPTSAPPKSEEAPNPDYWHSIKYLLTISTKVEKEEKDLLKKIIDNIMDAYVRGDIDLHPHTITEITQVFINLDNFSFGVSEKLFFEAYSKKTLHYSWTLVHSELSQHLAKKLLDKGDKEGLLNLLDYFFGFATYEEAAISFFGEEPGKPYLQKKPFVEDFYLNELGRLFGKQIIDILGIDAIRVIIRKLTEIDKLEAYSITSGGIPSIEPTSQSVYSNDWEDLLVYFIRDHAPFLNKGQFDELIDEILYSKVQVLQRLGIHFIKEYFSEFSDKWWRYIESTDKDSALYIHEPYELLRKHSPEFTDEQFEKIINWIETINPLETYEFNGEIRDASAYRIRRWFTALSSGSQKSRELLAQKTKHYENKNNAQMTEHPEFDSFGSSHIGFEYPMTLPEFQQFSIEEQIKYIQEFKPQHEFDTSEEGLADLLKYAILEDPGKYLYKLDQFLPLHSLYANYLLDGITNALQKDKIDDFLLPLSFIEAKFMDSDVSQEAEKKIHYKIWFASSVSDFINAVVSKNEKLLLSRDEVDRVIDLLLTLLHREDLQDKSDQIRDGYISHVLNSTPGRLYRALIAALRLWAELASNAGEKTKWAERVKEYFTNKLSSFANTDKEFSIILGMELPFLLYLDKQWVTDHLPEIFNEKDANHFDYRFQTAFSRNYTPSLELYEFFKINNLFTKAIDYFKKESGGLNTLIIYAIQEWRFWKGNPEKDSLIAMIFEKRDSEQIKRLIDIAYKQKLDSEKVIYLWKLLSPIFDSSPNLQDSYSFLIRLFELLYNLNIEVFDLATAVLEKTKAEGRDAYLFLKHLYKIGDTNIDLAGKLVLQVYEKRLVGQSYDSDLQSLVTKLYETGQKNLADSICIAVGETGSLGLKAIYNSHN